MSDLLHPLLARMTTLQNQRVLLGFDGFVDHLVKVKSGSEQSGENAFVRTREALAHYLLSRHDRNFTLELAPVSTRSGGNMPITALALARMGMAVDAVGTLGWPEVLPIFKNLPPGSRQFSFAPPGTATALEFEDGKVILAEMESLVHAGWEALKAHVGLETLVELVQSAGLVALLNWSELPHSTEIWQGFLEKILPFRKDASTPLIFFVDLSDCSRREPVEIREAIALLVGFQAYGQVVLGLNRNEAQLVLAAFGEKTDGLSIPESGILLSKYLPVNTLLLHHASTAWVIQEGEMVQKDSFYQPQPLLSTGAGDNFNAGFCLGLLLSAPVVDCLTLAHAAAACYVTEGTSPDVPTLDNFLKSQP